MHEVGDELDEELPENMHEEDDELDEELPENMHEEGDELDEELLLVQLLHYHAYYRLNEPLVSKPPSLHALHVKY